MFDLFAVLWVALHVIVLLTNQKSVDIVLDFRSTENVFRELGVSPSVTAQQLHFTPALQVPKLIFKRQLHGLHSEKAIQKEARK